MKVYCKDCEFNSTHNLIYCEKTIYNLNEYTGKKENYRLVEFLENRNGDCPHYKEKIEDSIDVETDNNDLLICGSRLGDIKAFFWICGIGLLVIYLVYLKN